MNNNLESSKKIAKNTMMLYIRQIVILFLNLYTVRQVLVVLGETDYGVYTVVAGIVTMFSVLSSAMSQACQRFFSYDLGKKDYGRLNETFTMSLLVHFVIGLIVMILTETVGLWYVSTQLLLPNGRFEAAMFVYQAAVIVLLLTIVSTPYIAMVLANEDMNLYAAISIVEAFLKLVAIFVIECVTADKLKLYGVSFIVVQIIVITSYIVVRFCNYRFIKIVTKRNDEILRALSTFAGWNLFGAMIFPLKVQGLNIILNQVFGTGVISGRGIATSVSSAVTSFYTNFGNAIKPQIVKRYVADGENTVMEIVYTSSKITYFLMYAIMFPIIMEMSFVLKIWLVDVPSYAIIFSQIALVEALIESISNPLSALVDATGNIKMYQLVVGGMQLLNLPLSVLVIKIYSSPVDVYIVAIVIAVITFIARIVIISKITIFDIGRYLKEVVVCVLIASSLSMVITFGLKILIGQGLFKYFIIYTLFEIINLMFFWRIAFSQNEKLFIQNVFKRKRRCENEN